MRYSTSKNPLTVSKEFDMLKVNIDKLNSIVEGYKYGFGIGAALRPNSVASVVFE